MSTLYIRLPSRATADSADAGTPLYCQFAVAADRGNLERDGMAALSDMSELVSRARRVVLILAASDVTLLRVKVPPMSAARLRAALPNMVEDQLMSDPAENVVVPGDSRDDLRTVGVVHRGWLELLSRSLVSLGARSLSAVPAQLCLPVQSGAAVAAAVEYGVDADIAIRLSEQEGAGLPIAADQPELVAMEVVQALCAMVPQAPIELYVQQGRTHHYQDAIGMVPAAQDRVTVHADSWARWIAGAERTSLDLITGMGASAGPQMNWRPWRWPFALAAGLLIVNAIGLNVDWLRAKRDAEAMRAGMVQTYRAAFPKDPVVIDPVAQLRQKIAAGQRDSGQLAPDDFLALAAAFGEAWASAGQGPQSIAGLEYRDRGLSIKLKPGSNAPVDRLKAALGSRNLMITQAGANVLQIRSAK
ncbi:MAG: ral secretion pathway protein GspL [Noviherbaspirillum sp.]|nr:ral secretion pathway protein GspL [Noviherbaspirillum sp.]